MSERLNALKSFVYNSRYQLALVVFILLAIYPLSFFLFIPKWDSTIAYLPYRYFITDYLWNGHLPLWNPFQRMGYPGYADLQSGCWYPVVWVISLLGKYDITSLILEVIFTFVAAGLGMFKLSMQLHRCERTALLSGLAYALSGFMVGSTYLLVFLIGLAWLPWCIWSVSRWLNSGKWIHAYVAIFFIALNITGASPAFTLILGYILLGMLLSFFWKKRGEWSVWKSRIGQGLVSVLLLAALLAPFIVSFLDFAPYFNRSGKLAFELAILNPFVWQDYLSFVFPYAVISSTDWFDLTDLSLRNAYIGCIGLVGMAFAFTRKSSRPIVRWSLVGGIVISLVFALGDESPLYAKLYHLPGFGLFRHPAFFRAYAILCMLLLAGYGLRDVIRARSFLKVERVILWGFAMLIALAIPLAFSQTTLDAVWLNVQQILQGKEFLSSPVYSHIVLNGILLIFLAAITWGIAHWRKWSLFKSILVFAFADLFTQTSLTALTTMVYPISYSSVAGYFDSLPNEHNQHFNQIPLKNMDQVAQLISTPGIELNLPTYHKTLSALGENPLRFKAFDLARENGVLELNLENPILYVPIRYCQPGDSLQPGLIWEVSTEEPIPSILATIEQPLVGYNSFTANVSNTSDSRQWIVLNQNYHHLWKAYLNNVELPVQRVNELAMGAQIPPNSAGIIHFEYASGKLIWAMVCSACGYLLILITALRKPKSGNGLTFGRDL